MKIRKTLESVKPYVAGKTRPGAVKLSSNENPLGPSPRALTAITQELNHLHRYPDGMSGLLCDALATHYSLPRECFIAGNGSDEILALIAGTYLEEGDEIITARETFSEYNFSGLLFGGKVKRIPLKEGKFDTRGILKEISEKTKLIFIANPNNPTGTYLSEQELKAFLKELPPHVMTILDEAYAEFVTADDFPYGKDLIMENNRVIATRTFSKLYGLAGLRIGYAMAHPDLVQQIFRAKQAFNVNLLAQSAGAAALEDEEFINRTLELCRAGREYLYKELDRMGIFYYKTQANFICMNIGKNSKEAFDYFLNEGMAIRPLASFGMDQWIRFTIGTEEQNREFLRLLSSFLKG